MKERLKQIKERLDGITRPSALKRSKPELVKEIITITSFLPSDSPLKRRMWHVSNEMLHIPLCPACQNDVIYFRTRTCSYIDMCFSCHKKREQFNREQSTIEKYGVKSTLEVPEFIERGRDTIRSRYGVDYVSQSPEIREQIVRTCIERFGVDNPSKAQSIKAKKTETCLRNFGVENPLISDAIKAKIRETNLERYGSEYAASSPEIRLKIAATNLKKYGGPNPSNSPEVRRRAEATMLDRYGNSSFPQSEIPIESLNVLRSPDALKELNAEMSALEIAENLSVSQTTVLNYLHSYGITPTIFNTSKAEREIRTIFSSYECKFNCRNVIDGELDIYIPELNLAVEYNGLFWHSEAGGKDKWYHRNKYDKCREKGIRLISILESEWLTSKPLVISKLKHIAGLSDDERVYARKCQLVEVSTKDKVKFLNENHIQGDGASTINYGLCYNGKIVACMAMLKRNDGYLLNRYATSCNVIGGFTRILKHFEQIFNSPTIHTFADLRWSCGDLYLNAGFTKTKELPPDYYWVKGGKAWHKSNWRHTTGLKKLPGYDKNKSESVLMREHGFSKLWDCGKLQFTKNIKN